MTSAQAFIRPRRNYYLRTFLWGLGLAFLYFLPWIIFNSGYFFFYGDYNVQQIPFYQMIHDSVQNGNIGWSYTTDLGANIIGSYSFYMFGSPFFWITMLFPSQAVPYLVAPLLILKTALAALGAYTFLRRYVKNQNYAVIVSLVYACSGFSVYNIFFNHFHEALLIFPFMLAAIDMFIYEKRKGVVGFAIFVSCLMNYYFFAGQAVFIFIYWLIRMITGSFRMTLMEFLRFAVEVVLGFFASAVLLFPSILAVMQNSRVSSSFSGWGGIVYSSEQKYVHILESFFFPPDMPAYANFTPDSNAKWASVAGWLPLFSMVGVFAFFKHKTHKWLRIFIPLLFVIAFVPIFNSIFQLLNPTYYARWFYMLTLMLCLATAISLDRPETDFKPALKLTFIITAVIAALIGFMPVVTKGTDGTETTNYGLEKYPDRYWIWVAMAVLCIAVFAIILCFRKRQKLFIILTSISLSVVVVGYANVLIGIGVLNASYKRDYIIDYAIGNKDAFPELEDLHEVRSDFYNEMDNMGMYWQIPTIQAFQSIVPGSVMDFYKSVGVERSVGSRPKTDVYAVRGLLSVKYLFDNNSDSKKFASSDDYNLMPGWEFLEDKNGYSVYENKYFIPYGFTYDTYVTQKEYDDTTEANKSKLLLKSIVLSDEQIKKYGSFLKHDENLSKYSYSQSEYFNDCEDRSKLVCSSVEFENNRFTAEIKTGDSAELVFFSIPYENGWSAEVNGKPAEIEKVNVGFMAVKVPANTNAIIKFTYKTPGLIPGLIVTLVSIALFVVYMIFWKVKRRKPNEDGSLILIDDLAPEQSESVFSDEVEEDPDYYDEDSDEEADDYGDGYDNGGEPEDSSSERVVELSVINTKKDDDTDASDGAAEEDGPSEDDDEGAASENDASEPRLIDLSKAQKKGKYMKNNRTKL